MVSSQASHYTTIMRKENIEQVADRLAQMLNEVLATDPEAVELMLNLRSVLDPAEYEESTAVHQLLRDLPDNAVTLFSLLNYVLEAQGAKVALQLLPANSPYNNLSVPKVALLFRSPFCPVNTFPMESHDLDALVQITAAVQLRSLAKQMVKQMAPSKLEAFIEELLRQSQNPRLCRRISQVAAASCG